MNKNLPDPKIEYLISKHVPENILREMLYLALYVPDYDPPFPKEITKTPELNKYVENFGDQNDDIAVMALKERQVIGLAWGRSFSEDQPGYGFISDQIPELSMAVKESFRNLGIGRRLLDTICQFYHQIGKEAVSLSVDHISPARRLYERCGFESQGRSGTSITMCRKIIA